MGNLLLIAGILSTATSALSADVTGKAIVLDGDTIVISSVTVRLHGIDAPENGQDCQRANGTKYNCGAEAEKHLKRLLSGSVQCTGSQFDNYDRLIGTCESNSNNVSRAMVSAGWALAFRKFSTDYVSDEQSAQASKRGLWAGSFDAPWDYRARRWQTAVEAAPDEQCPIKGNINRKGVKIYHAPWSRSYDRTRINTTKGERWFCSEAEAVAAGWRAPYR